MVSSETYYITVCILNCFAGVRRFYDNMAMMYGWRINPYMGIGWTITSPIFCMVLYLFLLLYGAMVVFISAIRSVDDYCDIWRICHGNFESSVKLLSKV